MGFEPVVCNKEGCSTRMFDPQEKICPSDNM